MIYRCQLRSIRTGHLLMLQLGLRSCYVPLAGCPLFRGRRPCLQTAGPSVIAHAVNRGVVDYPGVIDVVNVRHVNVVDAAVVIESAIAPVTSGITHTGIAESIIHPSIEAHRWTPVAGVP